MTVLTDAQRRTLHEGAQEAMGKEPADILLASLPPRGWDDLATKADVALLRADLEVGLTSLRTDLTDKITTSTWIHVGATLGALIGLAAICVTMIARI